MTAIFPLRARPCIALALCCTGLLVPSLSAATEWTAKPSVSLRLQHDTNLLLTPGPHEGVTGLTVAPHLDLSAQQANWDVMGSAELRSHRYWGQSGLNGNDQIYNLSSLYRTQRSTWQLGGGYAKESITASSTFSPDVGLVSTQTQRITRTVSPSWTWQMTERAQLKLGYQSSLVSYERTLNANLINYDSRDGNATFLYQWSPQDQLTATIDRSYFKVPQTGLSQLGQPAYALEINGMLTLQPNPRELSNTSTTNSLILGWTHSFSQTLSANVAIGVRHTDSESIIQTCTGSTQPTPYFINGQLVGIATCTQTANTGFSETSSGYLYNAGVTKQFELTQVALSVGRQVSPSGIGTQVLTDSATLGITRTLSARLNANLSAADYRIRAIGSNALPLTDRDYVEASTSLSWQWTRQFTIQGGYQYDGLKFPGTTDKAYDNAVYVDLVYAWNGFSVSR